MSTSWLHCRTARSVLLVLVSALFMSCASAEGADTGTTPLQPGAGARGTPEMGDKTELGVKSWAVRKAVKLLTKGIRAGSSVMRKLIEYMDDEAAEIFRRNAFRIADGLDDIARLPDVTMKIVAEKIFYFMINELHISQGSAQVIKQAIEGMLWILL